MLKKINRLSKFKRIENLKSVTTPFFVLKYKKEDARVAKFGFIVSKKIDKRATVRNKIKRMFQKAVQENIEKILPFTFLIIAKERCVKETEESLSKTLSFIFTKENLLK